MNRCVLSNKKDETGVDIKGDIEIESFGSRKKLDFNLLCSSARGDFVFFSYCTITAFVLALEI